MWLAEIAAKIKYEMRYCHRCEMPTEHEGASDPLGLETVWTCCNVGNCQVCGRPCHSCWEYCPDCMPDPPPWE